MKQQDIITNKFVCELQCLKLHFKCYEDQMKPFQSVYYKRMRKQLSLKQKFKTWCLNIGHHLKLLIWRNHTSTD